MSEQQLQQKVYLMLTGEDDGRVCRDIPESACREQPGNFLRHLLSLAATKTGDGLSDPKLVLSWLLASLGAPAFLIGLLVPLREAGALLPQLFIAGRIRSLPIRKWVWVVGSVVQGICVIVMGLAALTLEGALAGWVIVGLVAVFAIARSACSVSYKDVLGKTVSKATRGTATGSASSLAAVAVLLFGLSLSIGLLEKQIETVAVVLFLAGGLWILSAALFSALVEEPGATEGGGNPIKVAMEQLSLLRDDTQLVLFIATRGLLICTALAPPYLLALTASEKANTVGQLGPFVIASAVAAILSGYVWGRLADKSSRLVLAASAAISTALFIAIVALSLFASASLSTYLVAPALLFFIMIAYNGVRLGRATHIVDMATQETRAAYTALSNTIVGILLLGASGFAVVAQLAGETAVFVLFAAMSAGAAVCALRLEEVQRDGG